jgi:hypothetical protein
MMLGHACYLCWHLMVSTMSEVLTLPKVIDHALIKWLMIVNARVCRSWYVE